MKTRLLGMLLLLLNFSAFAQPPALSDWNTKSLTSYAGVYHFGDSEDESELRLIVAGQKIFAQRKTGGWASDGDWINFFEKWIKWIGL